MYLFIGSGLETHSHNHHALQLAITTDEPFYMKVKDGEWGNYTSLMLASDCPHQCNAAQSIIIFISIDPSSLTAKKLKEDFLKSSLFYILPDSSTKIFINDLMLLLNNSNNCNAILELILQFIAQLSGAVSTSLHPVIDSRIEKVIHIIKNSHDKKITLEFIAQSVFLSESRLVHLFKEQIGISIRKYILWNRINIAVKKIIDKENLTEAAYSAGFSDAAHFSRTFSKVFGISPSTILKNSQNIQAFVCNQ
ncbi:MAG: AraC family transcriptional regulator [Ignavibacteriaceae bacterium]|jgi:AraC-like DNA-binding protein